MARMLDQLDVQPGRRGAGDRDGSGYNVALLAHVVGETGAVVAADSDACGDGGLGWSERAHSAIG